MGDHRSSHVRWNAGGWLVGFGDVFPPSRRGSAQQGGDHAVLATVARRAYSTYGEYVRATVLGWSELRTDASAVVP